MSEENNYELLSELRDILKSRKGKPINWCPNAAFQELVVPDEALARIVGSEPMTRSELARRLWVYIRENNLQNPWNRMLIHADEPLSKVLNGRKHADVMYMTILVLQHVRKDEAGT